METTDDAYPVIGRRQAGFLMLSGLALAGFGVAGARAQHLGSTPTGGPIWLDISTVDVVAAYTPGSAATHIENRLPKSPAEQFEEWAGARLVPEGAQGTLQVTIVRASLTEEELETAKGFKAFFRDEQSRLVRVEFEGVFQFSDPGAGRSMTLTVRSGYEHSIAESASISEADEIRMGVVTEGLALFDQEFRKELRESSQSGWPRVGG